MGKRIYLDYASTTPLDLNVKKAMEPYWSDDFANPSAVYRGGVVAWNALTMARKKIAKILRCHADEIISTSGGTESNNLAIFGTIAAFRQKGLAFSDIHVVTSSIEHASVRECLKALEGKGLRVTYLPVREKGIVNPRDVEKSLTGRTKLVSIMYANNEIGTIQPIHEIGRILRAFGRDNHQKIIFHSDGSQAPLYLPLDTQSFGVDLLTLDGHKMYGPKGVGVLFVSRDITLVPIMKGGGQERGLRAGTPNVPLIVGFSAALENAANLREKETVRLTKLRDYVIGKIQKSFPNAVLNGDPKERLPNNINFSFPGVDTEFLVVQLDERGVACSTKSACLEHEAGSYVVEALGGDKDRSRSSLRLTLGRDTKKSDIDYVVKCLQELTHGSR